MKSQRQHYIDIIMKDDEDNELQLEFLQSLTLKDLEEMSKKVDIPDDDL
jgi:hypothetical protein